MSLDKAIEHGEEKRKQYRGAKSIDPCCRNHKKCRWCTGNRTNFDRKARLKADMQLKEI